MSNWDEIKQYFGDNKEIIVLVHEKPDGDCLGSALAMVHHLTKEGYKPTVYHPYPIPTAYDFLPGLELIKVYPEKELPRGIPLIAVDCADEQRILYPLPQDVPVINIDHHCSNTFFGDFNLVEPMAAATGEIIFELLSASPYKITPMAATCLFAALAADTGSFSYGNTTAKTFNIAGELINSGADINLIRYNLYERRPLPELLAIKLALTGLQFSGQGQLAWSVLRYHEMYANNLLETDTDSIVSLVRSVEGVEAAFVFKELEPQKVKISLRSKTHLDVNVLANEFGGGGHPRAAGCTIEGNLDEITARVVGKAELFLKEILAGGGDSSGRSN